METLNDIRRAIKPFSMKLKTKTFSFGRMASYIDAETGIDLDNMMFSVEHMTGEQRELLDRSIAFHKWKKENRDALKRVRENEDCRGLL